MNRQVILEKLTNETITLLKNSFSGEVFDYEILIAQLNKAMDIGSSKFKYRTTNNSKKRCVIQLDKFGNELDSFKSIADASRQTGAPKEGISLVCRSKRHQAGGFIWKFKT